MSELQETPEKQFFRTAEVCQLTDTQPYVLRFWESEFPQLAPEHGRGGQPLYRRRDVEIVLRIKQLLYDQEFTIEGARRQLALELSDGVEASQAPASAAIPGGTASPEERIAELDPVPRQRYDDAIEEIELLRLKLRESEATQRKAELRAQRAEEVADRERQRSRAAAGRLEALLAALEATDSA